MYCGINESTMEERGRKKEVSNMTAHEGQRMRENAYWNLVVGPVIGLLYVIALPFIAIGTVVVMIGKKAVEGAVSFVGSLVSFSWRPSEAHLAGKKKDKKRKAGDSE